ncbi:MAG TPA: DUF6496 domain-containing protein [Chryseolinea sp.]|nr:DUF6496 domain-containing protein [Chryseolinea sp.]
MAKYGKKAQSKVKRAMHEMKEGTLRSGRGGKKVTSRKQAIAIGLSEARQAGGKVPRKTAKKTSRKMGRPAKKRASSTKRTARKTRASRKSPRKSSR